MSPGIVKNDNRGQNFVPLPIQKSRNAKGETTAGVAENAEGKRGKLLQGQTAHQGESPEYHLYKRKLP